MVVEFMPFGGWWSWFWENDKTIICTKHEHSMKVTNEFSKVIEIDWKLGYFTCGKKVGFRYSKKREGEFLKNLISYDQLNTRG